MYLKTDKKNPTVTSPYLPHCPSLECLLGFQDSFLTQLHLLLLFSLFFSTDAPGQVGFIDISFHDCQGTISSFSAAPVLRK